MSILKGSDYAGSHFPSTGGFAKQSKQPKAAWGGGGDYKGNMAGHGDPSSKKGAMLGKKWKSTCSGCGGKM